MQSTKLFVAAGLGLMFAQPNDQNAWTFEVLIATSWPSQGCLVKRVGKLDAERFWVAFQWVGMLFSYTQPSSQKCMYMWIQVRILTQMINAQIQSPRTFRRIQERIKRLREMRGSAQPVAMKTAASRWGVDSTPLCVLLATIGMVCRLWQNMA